MVYISDMETNELVYMNRHLRDALGFENHAQYQGQIDARLAELNKTVE